MRKSLVLIVLLMTITATAMMSVNAKEVKLSMRETKEEVITNFTVPIPLLGDFDVYIKLKTETQGDLTVDLSVSKQTISPGDELEIYVKPISGKLKITRTPIVEIVDPKAIVHKKELTSVTDEKDFPGQFDISIPLPISDILKAVIMYYTGGGGSLIPIPSIGANIYGTVKTYPKIYIKVEGCYPELAEVTLYSSKPETVKVKKIEGVGAKIILDSWNLNSVIETSSDIYGGEYKGEISTISYKLVDKKEKVNTVITTLKTPVQITLNDIKTVKVGEETLISGFIEPKAKISLRILDNNIELAKISSTNDGKFSYVWIPKTTGKHIIKVVHDGSDFTTPTESNVVTVNVEKTSIQIKLNEIGTVKVGEKTLISGTVEPKLSINLKILCDNKIITTIRSSSDGKFDYIWTPKVAGKHFIKVVHDGSEFTKPAESNIVTVVVKAPPTPTKTTISSKILTKTTQETPMKIPTETE
jgi:hypothetical protein